MKTNHQMNYYDYGKNLDIQGVMPVIGGGVNPDTLDYVDLGLPSGTLWAKHNIQDADGNELYFAWGETSGYTAEQVGNGEGKRAFSWNDYEFGPYSALTKYNSTDRLTVLEPEDDAATANWGEGWRMPTEEQFKELTANATMAFTEQNGVNGLLFTSKVNNNTLFFPAVGYAVNGMFGNVERGCACWSASLLIFDTGYVSSLVFGEYTYQVNTSTRCNGYSVRPVRSNN